ncbi:hypothetical protein M427DRAFT_360101 [Gonapodya prolifera JEL478]|uniref:Uncharacterized protein n=1 Tax=Gonapodya prolifera (strain JEL478) TaxID=1344416 RepID=A0A139ABT3_GONPJ|nr:hypothetical protein M427DRAFT_360101 [Gonapodya prolifera JEL478]|eukprot:KXS13935.1 hypothetical protein M427DRAFT_360101 [Gonapodya prolifera JEL478]
METPPCLVRSLEPFLYAPKPISGFIDEFAGPVLGLKNPMSQISNDPSYGILVSPYSLIRFFLFKAPATHNATQGTHPSFAWGRRPWTHSCVVPRTACPTTCNCTREILTRVSSEMYGARQFAAIHEPLGICFIFYQPLNA